MLVRDTKQVYRYKVEKIVGKDASGKDVLDCLFGDHYGDRKVDFVIREWQEGNGTFVNRLNMLWAIPFTLICAPFQYIAYGQIGWDTRTSFGRWLLRITGHLSET